MEVVVGSYEEILHGYRLVKVNEDYHFEQSFTDHSHAGCIKSVAVSRKALLASGGTDEIIQLFNLKKRSQLGSLSQHSGSITCVDFFNNSHMFSASEDGTLCIWKTFTWECLKTLRGHKGTVNWLSVHPSGKLALSVGQDKTLRTWNLITGRSAYITNIKKAAEMVVWSPDGSLYAVVFDKRVDVYKMETATVCSSWSTEKKINTLVFISDSIIAYGGEAGVVCFHDVINNSSKSSIDVQVNRIRGIAILHPDSATSDVYMFTASSDGFIKAYLVNTETMHSKLLAAHNTDFRLTCIAVVNHDIKTVASVKHEEDFVEDKVTEETEESRVLLKTEEIKSELDSDTPSHPVNQNKSTKKKSKEPSPKTNKQLKEKLKKGIVKRLDKKEIKKGRKKKGSKEG